MIELTAADGNTLSAYRADPSDTPKGAVVVLHEVFNIDPHIRTITENFAALGYVAIAPALFDRVKKNVELGYDEAGLTEGLELKSQVGIGDAIADVQAAVDAVKDAGKVAVVAIVGEAISPISQATRWWACLRHRLLWRRDHRCVPGEAENPNLAPFQRGRSADPVRRGDPIPGFPARCQRLFLSCGAWLQLR
jgi:Dienelactone hydrolase family